MAGGEDAGDAEVGDGVKRSEGIGTDIEGTVEGDGTVVPGSEHTLDGGYIDTTVGIEGSDDDGVDAAFAAVRERDGEAAQTAYAGNHSLHFIVGIDKIAGTAADEDIDGDGDSGEGGSHILLRWRQAIAGEVFTKFYARSPVHG